MEPWILTINRTPTTNNKFPEVPHVDDVPHFFFCFSYFFVILHLSAQSILFIPARDAQCRVPENQKDIVARYASFHSLRNVLSYLFFFFFFLALLHECSRAVGGSAAGGMCMPRAVCVCALLPSGPSRRWLGSAVWNSADPLK